MGPGEVVTDSPRTNPSPPLSPPLSNSLCSTKDSTKGGAPEEAHFVATSPPTSTPLVGISPRPRHSNGLWFMQLTTLLPVSGDLGIVGEISTSLANLIMGVPEGLSLDEFPNSPSQLVPPPTSMLGSLLPPTTCAGDTATLHCLYPSIPALSPRLTL